MRCGIEFKTAAALAVVLVVALGFAVHHFWTGRPETIAVPARAPGTLPGPSLSGPRGMPPGGSLGTSFGPAPGGTGGGTGAKAELTVDIAGKVRRPGVRRLPAGSRVADALAAAGGALPGTDTSTLNLARPLSDGEQVLVGAPAPPPTGGAGPATPISLSSATPDQLESLPGVGPVLAQRIVEYRTRHGGFASVDQLRHVTGVGDRRFTDLKPLVRP